MADLELDPSPVPVSFAPDPDVTSTKESDPSSALGEDSTVFSGMGGLLAGGFTGFLYFLAFPGVDFWPAAFVAWVPWLVALRGATPGRAALQGLFVGLVSGLCGFYWLLNMLQTFSGFSAPICAIFVVILCAYQGGIFSLLGWLYARGTQRGWGPGLVFACAFVASETVYPLLFPFTFGATMHDVFPIVQAAEIGGPVLVALIVLAPNWAISLVVSRYLTARRLPVPIGIVECFRQVGWRRFVPLFLVPALSTLYGLVRIVQVDQNVEHAEKVRVGIVQANMSLEAKRSDQAEGLKRHVQLTRKLVQKDKIDLVVWPETAVAGAIHEDRAADYYRRHVTGKLGVASIVGAVLYRDVDDAREQILFNSALMADERGHVMGRYDKQILLLFGEYLPFGDAFPILHAWSPNSGHFSPGTSFQSLKFRGHEIATFICYEDIVPSFVNRFMSHGRPELLVNMTNDAWFGDSSEPWEHMALSKLRAVEQRRYFVRSTNSGVSGFVDPVGRLTQRTKTFEKAAVSESVAWLDSTTPYSIWGNWPWYLLSVVSFGLATRTRRRSLPATTVLAPS